LQSAVSRIFNPQAFGKKWLPIIAKPRRMQFGDTADCKSALPSPPLEFNFSLRQVLPMNETRVRCAALLHIHEQNSGD
jgi:hypothetical protein